ncbi:hypothetical protein Bp8pS_048 [Bacillus phage vB_BpuM-BpSp]|nr:hypothetical protein Bp8pS_048 [Bacillus phage vB_BpuM-BpSp]
MSNFSNFPNYESLKDRIMRASEIIETNQMEAKEILTNETYIEDGEEITNILSIRGVLNSIYNHRIQLFLEMKNRGSQFDLKGDLYMSIFEKGRTMCLEILKDENNRLQV